MTLTGKLKALLTGTAIAPSPTTEPPIEVYKHTLKRSEKRPIAHVIADLKASRIRIWLDAEGRLQFHDADPGRKVGVEIQERDGKGRKSLFDGKLSTRHARDNHVHRLLTEIFADSDAVGDHLFKQREDSIMTQLSRLFAPSSKEEGGQRLRVAKIKCGNCPFEAEANVGHFASNDTPVHFERAVSRKFQERGWLVGGRPLDHRCPACARAELERKRTGGAQPSLKIVEKDTSPMTTKAAPPPQMDREHRRIVFEKLQEVYVNETTGYSGDWTDKKVAESLGCPRAWIAQIREENFGPEGNNELITAELAKAGDVLQRLYDASLANETTTGELRATATALNEQAADLVRKTNEIRDAAHSIERRLAEIQKTLR